MELSKSLPAIVVRGTVPIPNNDFRIEVGRKVSLKALEEAEKNFGSYALVLIQKNPLSEGLKFENTWGFNPGTLERQDDINFK